MEEVSEADYVLDFEPKEPPYQWTKLPACEEFVGARRSKHTMVAWDDGLYIFGGDNGKRMLNDFLVFHIRDGSWARVVSTGSPPPPRYHHSAVVVSDSMFVFGGYTGDINSNQNLQNKNDLYEFKFRSSQWVDWRDATEGPLPPARSAHGAAVYKDQLYVFGGYDGHARLNDMWRIDLASPTAQWCEVNQVGGVHPPTCCNFPLAVVGDSMFLFSGQSGAKMTNNMYEFKLKENKWIRIPTEHLLRDASPPPQRRYGHVMVPYNRCLYIFGGVGDIKDDNELHCYDVDSRTWSVVEPAEGSQVPSPRLFHSASVWGKDIYLFGGAVDSAGTRSGDMFQLGLSSLPKCSFVDDFARLLLSEEFCDVVFEVGPQAVRLKGHAAVVAARSPLLKRRILETYQKVPSPGEEGGEESCSKETLEEAGASSIGSDTELFLPKAPVVVQVREAAEDTFRMALYFLYTDRLHPSLDEASVEGMTVEQMLQMMELYKLSLLLETPRMELLCLQYIQASVNEENVLHVLRVASELRLSSLKEYCLRSIVREGSYRQVVMSSSFESLDSHLMVAIVRRHQTPSRPTSPDTAHSRHLEPPATIQDDLKAFLKSTAGRQFSDVVLCVGEEVVHAHQAILAARCTYFEAMFRSFMPPGRTVQVTFGKHSPSIPAFHSLLAHVYHGSIQLPPEDALYVYSAPNFFGFHSNRLHDHCQFITENSVCVDNVLPILEVASDIGLQAVKRHCLMLISEHYSTVNQLPHFRSLSRGLLLDILDILASKLS